MSVPEEIERDLHRPLSSPALWSEPDPGLEDRIVDLIAQEASSQTEEPVANTDPGPGPSGLAADTMVPILRPLTPFLAGVAAAAVLVAGLFLAARLRGPDGVALALSGTDLAPEARADAVIDHGPLGVRIDLDVSGLPPAPDGFYYQAWVRQDAEIGVSAGPFHMRGGDGHVQLWAGVSTDDYPLSTVTIQSEDDGEASSGKIVLKGLLDSP